MKVLHQLSYFLLFLLLQTSCTQEEMPGDTNGLDKIREVEVILNMGIHSSIQTRTSRPVISSDNWQQVSNMRIYVFRSTNGGESNDQYTYYKPQVRDPQTGITATKDYFYVDAFKGTQIWGDTETENETHSYSIKPLLGTGHYKFLAVGRDDMVNDQIPSGQTSVFENIILTEGTTKLSEVYLHSNAIFCTEVFSGCSSHIAVTSNAQSFQTTIELKRTVTGVLMYVENIPAKLKAMATITKVNGSGDHTTLTAKGTDYTVSCVRIVPIQKMQNVLLANNTMSTEKPTTNDNLLYSFTSKEIVNAIIVNGYYTNTDLSNLAHPNSLLAGNFVIPQPETTTPLSIGTESISLDSQLYLVFYTSTTAPAGQPPVYWIPIKMLGTSPSGTATFKYPLLANHFYSLGKKNIAQNVDEPIDLKKHFEGGGSDIVITVNPDWLWVGDGEDEFPIL